MSGRVPAQSLSLLETITASTDFLTRHGVESARLNAEHLAAHVLKKRNRIDLYLEFDRPLGPAELGPLRQLVQQRAKGEPLQHLLGTTEFYGREFACDARALIPRPETEQLVELALRRLPADAPLRVVDVGTGSGIIALTLAAERPAARVEAVDVSPAALALAQENAARLGLAERVTFRAGDLLADAAPGSLDGIVANLPYIPSAEIPTLSREVQHDPHLALDGGPDGLRLVERLLAQATRALVPGGWIGLELALGQAPQVEAMCRAAGLVGPTTSPDLAGIERFVFAERAR
ncbi:MAG: peptide chain release factor N(5)-glutamine methyltransferase [Verrucomicrobia bacterium]|nr:peptide chain release factor N(5)-glutamine methyltransferase [Verrucomicrobiota bacterium]